MYLMREPAPVPAYLRPLSRDVVDDLARLIERILLRQGAFMLHWRALCTSNDAAASVPPERLLEETYVPRLRSAIECLGRGDTAGFLRSGRALGADLADAGVPFSAMVTHASFLKDGCASVLADDPVAVAPALLVLERPVACLVAAAADGYYRRPHGEPLEDPDDAGGTLLLDEVTEMGPELQAKLLRVLQERAVRPLGSTTEEPVDVRVIASTNRGPEAALRSGMLRPDLYYRLRGSILILPSLGARREDIPDLVEHHLSRLNREHGGHGAKVRGITASALRALTRAKWPGNVRELLNVVEHAFTMCSSIIRTHDLDLAGGVLDPVTPEADTRLPTFHENERTLIERVLHLTRGNKLRAARELGISRKALYARMARYGLMGLALHAVARR